MRTPTLHAILFVLAFAVRYALLAATVGASAPPKGDANPDQLDYELFAANLAAGHGYVLAPGEVTGCRPPGTAFVLAPVYVVFGRDFAAARLWFCLLSALCVPVAGAVAHRVVSPRAGLLAAAWLAFYPGHAYYALHFLSETPVTLLTGLAMLLQIMSLRRNPNWRDVLLGLVLGLGILVRPSLGVMAVVCGTVALVAGGLPWRVRFAKAALMTGAACILVLPWAARNQVAVGKPALTTIVGGYTFWGANNPKVYDDPHFIGYWIACSSLADAEHPLAGTEAEREAAAWKYGTDYRTANAGKLPTVMLHRFGRVVFAYPEAENRAIDLGFRGGWFLSLPFVLVGLATILRRAPAEWLILVGPLAAVAVTTASFYGCSRFRDGAAPALAVFFAAGLCAIWAKVGAKEATPPPAPPPKGEGSQAPTPAPPSL